MNDRHLSLREQEAYVLGEKTPEQARHMDGCSVCRAGVARMEYGIARFRESSLRWAEDCMQSRLVRAPQPKTARVANRLPALQLGSAAAAVLAITAFLLHPWTVAVPAHPAALPTTAMSDDALLEQVDAQLAAGVPDSMHPLTHLVSANSGVAQHE